MKQKSSRRMTIQKSKTEAWRKQSRKKIRINKK